jgi:poly-gamma-glutamate synthesis protein (capsule biosynthesis protein)
LASTCFQTPTITRWDFGIDGLLNTMREMKQAGAVYAGVGENLGEARAPGYLSTAHGRVALIACASTFQHDSPAGQSRPDLLGRPGINPLQHQTKYEVDASTLSALQKLKDDLHLGARLRLKISVSLSKVRQLRSRQVTSLKS